jgi:hypothetical protein
VEVSSGMKILQETRGRLARLLDRIVSNLRCRLKLHSWITPEGDCIGEKYTRYGERKCLHCGREEKLLISKFGRTEWYCPKEKISKLFASLRKGNY